MDEWRGVSGMTNEPEIRALQRMVQDLQPGSLVVEVGVCQGRSLIAMIEAGQELTFVGVDNFSQSNPGYVRPDYHAAVRNVAGRAEIVVGDSSQVGREWDRGKIDLLLHDGSHEEEKVVEDIEAWWPHVSGWLVFHDWESDGWPGVRQGALRVLGQPTKVEGGLGIYEAFRE